MVQHDRSDEPAMKKAARPVRLRLSADNITSAPGHVPSLDGLRAMSIMIVVVAHISRIQALPGGFGVTLFFFISGYIITRLLLLERKERGRIDIGDFYMRRIARLYPVLLVFVLTSVVLLWLRDLPINWTEVNSVLFYFANYYQTIGSVGKEGNPTGMGIFWSLSVEEHFYLLFPLIFVVLAATRGRLMGILLAVCAASLAIRAFYHATFPIDLSEKLTYFHSESRFDSIAYGVVLALCFESPRLRAVLLRWLSPVPVAIALAAILATFVLRDAAFRDIFRYSIQGVALFVLVAAILTQDWLEPAQRLLNARPVVFIGKISYSLYVWHLFSAYLCKPLDQSVGHVAYSITAISLTFAVSVSSFYIVEKPFVALRKRLRDGSSNLAVHRAN